MDRQNAWLKSDAEEMASIMSFAEDYRQFISNCKTERECVKEIVSMAKEKGCMCLSEVMASGRQLKPGDRVYVDNMGKALALFTIGKKPIEDGLRILGSHIDSPRLDIKQNPLYEDEGMVLLDTHYYGGIKKYQWVTMPLAIHGVVALTDGRNIEVAMGEEETDPVVGVTDLLIHLAGEQLDKKGAKVVEGEALDILAGNMPLSGECEDAKQSVKANILSILKEKYGIAEEDFMSAELEAVPSGPARNMGMDNSMIIGYGQDDRVCAYPSVMAYFDSGIPEYTPACLLMDKDEIGSVGATGCKSLFFENMLAEVMECCGQYSELKLRRALAASVALSADVNSAYDSNYASAFEKKNSSYLGKGVVIKKFTGSRGKSSASDANAETVAKIRKIMEDNDIAYQIAEIGKVDLGGGGTIAYILANYDMEVLDCGVPVLSMHAPYEVTSKVDIYETYRLFKAFVEK